MNIKCKLGFHSLEEWTTYRFTKRQETFCRVCHDVFHREMPPLLEQLREILKMDISREEMNRKLDNLSDWYGYQRFTRAMLLLARQHFRVPNREPRYETRERLVMHYMYKVNILTMPSKYAKMAIRLIK